MIKNQIMARVQQARQRNQANCDTYKKKLLSTLASNLEKGQTKEANQSLIDRYIAAKPAKLTTMQQALANAGAYRTSPSSQEAIRNA